MIIVKLKGGLGNQMFQYAFARRISAETGRNVKLDTVNGFINDYFERKYCLDHFGVVLGQAANEVLKKYSFYTQEIPGRIYNRISKCFGYYNGYIIKEKEQFRYDNSLMKNVKSKYYDGYWQHPKYFSPIREILLKELTLKNNTDIPADLEEEIRNCNSVGIHIRTPHAVNGNSIDKSALEKYEVLTEEYYLKAVEIIKNIHPDAVLYIVTGDNAYAEKIIRNISHRKIISNNEYIDMHLLSKCRHQIITNSTFGWWGAWLNNNNDKIVISPKYWFKNHSVCIDSLLRNFITI